MDAWAKDQGVEHSGANDKEGRITFLGDPEGELTKKLEMELNHPGPKGKGIIGRCKRFAVYAVNGEVKWSAVSEANDDPAGDDDPSKTLAPAVMSAIMKIKDEL